MPYGCECCGRKFKGMTKKGKTCARCKAESTTPEWIKQARKRALGWLLLDVKMTEEEWNALKYEELLALPIVERLSLIPTGGRLRFPGSEYQENHFGFTVTQDTKYKRGVLGAGEEYFGLGLTLVDAVRSAIQLAVEMASMRGKRTDPNQEQTSMKRRKK